MTIETRIKLKKQNNKTHPPIYCEYVKNSQNNDNNANN